jgi:hypothetical protein
MQEMLMIFKSFMQGHKDILDDHLLAKLSLIGLTQLDYPAVTEQAIEGMSV